MRLKWPCQQAHRQHPQHRFRCAICVQKLSRELSDALARAGCDLMPPLDCASSVVFCRATSKSLSILFPSLARLTKLCRPNNYADYGFLNRVQKCTPSFSQKFEAFGMPDATNTTLTT
jgi:hypothetical protein